MQLLSEGPRQRHTRCAGADEAEKTRGCRIGLATPRRHRRALGPASRQHGCRPNPLPGLHCDHRHGAGREREPRTLVQRRRARRRREAGARRKTDPCRRRVRLRFRPQRGLQLGAWPPCFVSISVPSDARCRR
eukprot:scaffold27248_cov133-Isochrysis_galbana.AAC.11